MDLTQKQVLEQEHFNSISMETTTVQVDQLDSKIAELEANGQHVLGFNKVNDAIEIYSVPEVVLPVDEDPLLH